MKVWARRVLPLFAVLADWPFDRPQEIATGSSLLGPGRPASTVDPAVDERRRLEADNRQIMQLLQVAREAE